MLNKPYIICLEGLDGCGKSTQAKRLAELLPGFYTKEPSDYPIGQLIRQRLTGQGPAMSETTLQLMFAADRGYHFASEIEPRLQQNIPVIYDRYFFSALALGHGQDIDQNWLNEINRYYPAPDFLFFIDTPLEECFKRLQAKNPNYVTEHFERQNIQTKAQSAYLSLVNNYSATIKNHPRNLLEPRAFTIDGRQSIDEITNQILSIINQ
jgi:dTMP kinase